MNDDIAKILEGGAAPAEDATDVGLEQTVLVSKRVLEGDDVLFAYRDVPEESDSGWTLLAGDEPDATLADREQFDERTVSWALDRDASLMAILAARPDSSFERQERGSDWIELEEDDEE